MKMFSIFFAFIGMTILCVACNNTPSNNLQTSNNINLQTTSATKPAVAPLSSESPDDVAVGRADYAQFCIRCHKPDGAGGLFELEDGKKLKIPSLREGPALKLSDQELSKQINNGGDGMPAYKNKLDQKRIDELIRFIHKEFHSQSAPGSNPPNTPAH